MSSDPSQQPAPDEADAAAKAFRRQVKRRSRRAFIGLGLGGLVGALGWRWLLHTPLREGLPGSFRKGLELNEQLARATFRPDRLAPEFPKSHAEKPRFNGKIGLRPALDAATWRLRVRGYAPGAERVFALADIQALPRTEMTVEFKCIEGWSRIITFAGARLSDFLARYPLATASGRAIAAGASLPADVAPYVSLATPDRQYYVGLDIESALHPQTLLCYEMNGAPLTPRHGAPLRLVTPLKYGVKHIKRIGTIVFTDQRPADYWAERGYDWYAGH